MREHTYTRLGKEFLEKKRGRSLATSPEKAMKSAEEFFRELKKISNEIQSAYEDVTKS